LQTLWLSGRWDFLGIVWKIDCLRLRHGLVHFGRNVIYLRLALRSVQLQFLNRLQSSYKDVSCIVKKKCYRWNATMCLTYLDYSLRNTDYRLTGHHPYHYCITEIINIFRNFYNSQNCEKDMLYLTFFMNGLILNILRHWSLDHVTSSNSLFSIRYEYSYNVSSIISFCNMLSIIS